MKKKFHFSYVSPQKVVITGAFIISMISMASCVDKDYDLSKDIDLTFKLGGDSISGPVGSTDTIYLSKILKVSDSPVLHTYNNVYYLEKDGSAENVNIKINQIKNNANIDLLSLNQTLIPKGTPIYPMEISEDLSGISSINNYMSLELDGVPDEVTSISEVSLANTVATISLKLSDVSGMVKLTKLNNVTLQFPNFIESPDLDSNHRLTLNGNVVNGTVTKNINISGINLGKQVAITNGKLSSDGYKVDLSGGITVASTSTGTLQNDVVLNFSINFSSSTVTEATGVFNPNISVTVDPVQLDNIPSWLQGGNVTMDIYNPEIKMEVDNSINIPIIVKNATITGANSVTIPDLHFDAAKSTVNYITRQGTLDFDPSPITANAYYSVKVPNMNDVIKTIPKEIGISMPNVTADLEAHSIALGKTYPMDMKYQVLIPFTFGNSLNISYNDTIKNLHKSLKDIDGTNATVTGTVYSDIPLGLTLSMTPVDSEGNDLSQYLNIDITKNIAAGGGNTTSVTSTPVTITITEKQAGTIKNKLDALLLNVGAASSDATNGKTLCSNQFMIMKNIRIKVAGGITVDCNKKDNN